MDGLIGLIVFIVIVLSIVGAILYSIIKFVVKLFLMAKRKILSRKISRTGSVKWLKKFIMRRERSVWHHDLVKAALERFYDNQQALTEIEMQAKSYNIRILAIEHLTLQNVLEQTARFSEWGSFREIAVSKLKNQEIIAEIALNDKNEAVRIAAIRRLGDQAVLTEIASGNNKRDLWEPAIHNIHDEALLRTFLGKEADAEKRLEAALILNDQQVLKEIVEENQGEFDWKTRETAIQGIKDVGFLEKVATNDVSYQVRMAAYEGLPWYNKEARDAFLCVMDCRSHDEDGRRRLRERTRCAQLLMAHLKSNPSDYRVFGELARTEIETPHSDWYTGEDVDEVVWNGTHIDESRVHVDQGINLTFPAYTFVDYGDTPMMSRDEDENGDGDIPLISH